MASHPVTDYPMLRAVLESGQKIVYLCGAGASMSLGNHRNSWGAWLSAGKTYLAPAQQAAFDALSGTSSAHDLITAASYLLKQLKAAGSYTAFMDETIGALHSAQPVMMRALQKVWRAGDLISTTNYDLLLEETVGAGYVTYERPGEILPVINGTAANRIIHLHGVYDKTGAVDNIIADGEQYRRILENAGAQFIQNLLSTHPILIVGCGGTVSDPNLAGFMQFMIEKLGLNVPYFYLIKEGDAVPGLPSNAVPICYGSEYGDLPSFLEELSSYRLRNRAEVKDLMLFDPYAQPKGLTSAFGRMHFANRFSEFTGRRDEREQLDDFLQADGAMLWWGVLGEGGIGKSRLILEWLRELPAHWFGFFARKAPEQFDGFVPFTHTVVVLDYILGEEERTAKTIEALMKRFEGSAYRLRLLLIERKQSGDEEDWLSRVNGAFDPGNRLLFEAGRYLNGAANADEAELMRLPPLCEGDELCYIQNYLKTYTSTFLAPADAARYTTQLDTVSRTIHTAYRGALEEQYRRPLYLSIFVEVWINRDGAVDIRGAKQLLKTYLGKEIDRWKILLDGDELVNSYLKLLAAACAMERFNITDVSGKNYLQKDCDRLTAFLDEQDSRPGEQSVFGDLFVEQDILEEFDPEDSLMGSVFDQFSQMDDLSPEDKLAFAAPYIKIDADPEEVHLTMLKQAGGLSEEDSARLEELRESRLQRSEALPDHAWIITPAFPDIIREYVVLYVLKERDIAPFAKLARANSVFGLGEFLARAVEDWPDEKLFQKMLVIPPDQVLDYFEFYFPLLSNAREIDDLMPVEAVLLEQEATHLFAKFEMELWFRIAIVLTEREDWDRLLDSGERFIQYAREACDHPKVQERAAEVLEVYCTGLHNAEQADLLDQLLSRCDELSVQCEGLQLARTCCDIRGKLLHLRRYLGQTEHMERDWNIIAGYITADPKDPDICQSAMQAADEYYTQLRTQKEDVYRRTKELADLLESVFENHPVLEVAELLSVSTANLYMMTLEQDHEYSQELFQKVQGCFNRFPGSKRVRSAYAAVCGQNYAKGASRARDVPGKVMARLKKWSAQYPDEIEFQEAYFGVMVVHLEYAQAHGLQAEKRRAFRELERIADASNYGEYGEENQLQERVELLRALFLDRPGPA